MLSVSCILNPAITSQVFAEDYCDSNRNSKGGYIDYSCADSDLSKVAYNKANFVAVENLGPFGDDEQYCFNLRALDDVFEKKKLESTASLDREYEMLDRVCEAPIFDSVANTTIGVASLLGAIGGYFFQKTLNSEVESQGNANLSPQNSRGDSNQNTPDSSPIRRGRSPARNNLQPGRGVLPACIGALIAAFFPFMFFCISGTKKKNNACNKRDELNHKIVNINKANARKADMLNLLLFFLDRPKHINFDMVCFHSQPNNFYWEPKYAGINYTKAELASFPEKFKEIAAKIRKNLEETGYLTPDNEISGKVVNPEQRELSD